MSAGTQNALAVRVENDITALMSRAESIVVSDQDTYRDACQITLDGRAKVRAIGAELDPGIHSAQATLDLLKNQKKRWVERYTLPIEMAARKAEDWKADERRKAQIEQDRINAENRRVAQEKAEADRKERERVAAEQRERERKEISAAQRAGDVGKREAEKMKKEADAKAERERILAAEEARVAAESVQQVTVKAAVPTVSGIKARVNWKFRMVNPSLIPVTYRVPDLVAIGTMVRSTKDKAAAEKQCPGIEVYTEDSI